MDGHNLMARFLGICILVGMVAMDGLAQWTMTNGPFGGFVTAFAHSNDRVFAGTRGAGVFESLDNGSTWQQLPVNEKVKNVNHMDARDSLLFVATEEGLMRSDDFGSTWKMVFQSQNGKGIETIYCTENFVYIGTELEGVWRVGYDNKYWEQVLTTIFGLKVDFIIGKDSILFAIGDEELYRSFDQGASWEVLDIGIQSPAIAGLHIYNDILFLGTSKLGMIRSLDWGDTWESGFGVSGWRMAHLDSFLFSLSGIWVYRSQDYGQSWDKVNQIKSAGYFPSPFLGFKGHLYLGSGDQGIHHSSDQGDNFENSSIGLTNAHVTDLIVYHDILFASLKSKGVSYLSDVSQTWIDVSNGIANKEVRLFSVWEDALLASTYPFGIYRFDQQGNEWQPFDFGLDSLLVNSMEVHAGKLFIGCYKGLYRVDSLNGSAHLIDQDISVNESYNWGDLLSIGDTLFGTNHFNLFWTNDDGVTWTMLPDAPHSSISQIGYLDGFLFVSGGQMRCSRWDPVAMNWIVADTGMILTVSDFYTLDDQLLVGGFSKGGVQRTLNDGKNWTSFSEGLRSEWVTTIQEFNDQVYIGTRDASVWKRHLNDFQIVNDLESIKASTSDWIAGIYPNPAQDQVYIDLDLPSAMDLQVRIMDPLGRTCSVEPGASFPAGKLQLTLALPSGVSGICRVVLQSATQIQSIPLFVQQE